MCRFSLLALMKEKLYYRLEPAFLASAAGEILYSDNQWAMLVGFCKRERCGVSPPVPRICTSKLTHAARLTVHQTSRTPSSPTYRHESHRGLRFRRGPYSMQHEQPTLQQRVAQ